MKKVLAIFIFIFTFGTTVVFADNTVYGDADGNNILTASDCALILQKVLNGDFNLPIEDTDYFKIVDVDNDGVLTARDCAYVLSRVLNSSFIFPCEKENDDVTEEDSSLNINISVGDVSFSCELYDNETAKAFMDMLPVTIQMSELNGNEKYHFFDTAFPTNSQAVGYINAGDLMLYENDCIVLFYDSFSTSYSYTPIGHIGNIDGLAEAVGSGSVTVTFEK